MNPKSGIVYVLIENGILSVIGDIIVSGTDELLIV